MQNQGRGGGLDAFAEGLDALLAMDPATIADQETVTWLFRQCSRLEAAASAAAAAFDASGQWGPSGARSAAEFLTVETHLPKTECSKRVALGKAARHLPVATAAWENGEIGPAHVRALAGVRRDATAGALARDEEMLVEQARTLPYRHFERAVAYWESLADPDGTEEGSQTKEERRSVYLSESFGGMFLGRTVLGPLSGSIVFGVLTKIEAEMFEADWAEAASRLGRDPHAEDLARTPGQRRADALVEMAIRAATAPADGRRPAPLFSVLVDWPTLAGRVCELASGTVLSPGALAPGWIGPT